MLVGLRAANPSITLRYIVHFRVDHTSDLVTLSGRTVVVGGRIESRREGANAEGESEKRLAAALPHDIVRKYQVPGIGRGKCLTYIQTSGVPVKSPDPVWCVPGSVRHGRAGTAPVGAFERSRV